MVFTTARDTRLGESHAVKPNQKNIFDGNIFATAALMAIRHSHGLVYPCRNPRLSVPALRSGLAFDGVYSRILVLVNQERFSRNLSQPITWQGTNAWPFAKRKAGLGFVRALRQIASFAWRCRPRRFSGHYTTKETPKTL